MFWLFPQKAIDYQFLLDPQTDFFLYSLLRKSMSTYYASKAYVLMFSEALNKEFSQDNVTVTVLCPGPTQTEFFKRSDMIGTKLERSPCRPDERQTYRDSGFNQQTVAIFGAVNPS